jgi:hypothetical protein
VVVAAIFTALFHGFELVFEDGLTVVKQPTYEGRFSIIHRAGGGESEQLHVFVGTHDFIFFLG